MRMLLLTVLRQPAFRQINCKAQPFQKNHIFKSRFNINLSISNAISKRLRFTMIKGAYILGLLLGSLACSGQAGNYHFRIMDLPENFKNQLITMVDKDSAGVLWFVTNSGLHRYDGNQVITFDMQSKPALLDINILFLLADSHSNIWVATRKGLVQFHLKTWDMQVIPMQQNQFSTTRDRLITAMVEGKDGSIYAGSANGKLFVYKNGSLQCVARLQPPANDSSKTLPGIRAIVATTNNALWLTTDKGQIVKLTRNELQKQPVYYEPLLLRQAYIDFLTFGQSGQCLVNVAETGLFLFDTSTGVAKPVLNLAALSSFGKDLNSLAVVRNDKIVFFFAGHSLQEGKLGVYDFNNNLFKSSDTAYTYPFKGSLFRKVLYNNGQIYTPTHKGIGVISYLDNPFQISQSNLQNINSIRTIYKAENGLLYIGSYKEKFLRLNEATSEKKQLSNELISCLIPWRDDTLLAGIELGFPQWYIPATNQLVPVFKSDLPPKNANINKNILCLRQENDTLVWAGVYGGCYLFNPVKGTIVKTIRTNEDSLLQQLNVDDILKVNNNRFFATTEGIFKYNISSGLMYKLFTNTDNSYTNGWYSCLRLVGSQIWAGSHGNGIVVFDTSGALRKKITTNEGLAGNIVFSLPASGPFVLAGTINGLSVIDTRSGAIRNYSSSYNLPANEFNRSAWFVNGDTVYMGTVNGIIRFCVSQLQQYTAQSGPLIKFLSFSINNGSHTFYDYTVGYSPHPLLAIPAGTKSFSFSFGGLDDVVSELDLFYRFGNDGTWQQMGQRREITFVNMEPGNYTLQIAARLPDGQWTGNLLTIPLDVQPLFYQTIWFKLILAVLSSGLIGLGIKYRERNLRKEQQLRSRIAGDLHDEVGSALTRIYFQAGMLSAREDAVTGVPTSALQKIADSSQEALSSMSDMVWSIDSHYDNAADMIGRMKDYIARLQEEMECRCQFEVTGNTEKKPLTQTARQNIFLIFKEAVNNAIKYGTDKKIIVQVNITDRLFILIVKNTLPQQLGATLAQGGHGLQGMKLRAGKVKATFSAIASAGEFIVCLKVNNG